MYEQVVGMIVLFGLLILATVPEVARASNDVKTLTRIPEVAIQVEGLESLDAATNSTPHALSGDVTSTLFLTDTDGKGGEIVTEPTVEQVKAEIIAQAKVAGVSEKAALRIASCESSFKFNAKNPRGSAKGVYQFIDRTWKYIDADGHQYDYKENIRQFMKWYPKHPGWWQCK